MGIIFFIFIALVIFEIYIRRNRIQITKHKNKASLFSRNQITALIVIVLILPVLIIIALQTDLIGYDSENIREVYKTDLEVEDTGIYLTGERIKKKVYNKLNKPMDEKITRSELNQIIAIDDLKSETVDDLKHFKNLERLEITWTNDDSLLPIQNLNLKYLSLENADNIDDIDPIGNITTLEILKIESEQITNLSPLENLDNLETLYLNTPQVRDFSPIKKILNLEELYLNGKLTSIDEL